MKKIHIVISLLFVILLLSSCIHEDQSALVDSSKHIYGFWGGLWHGITAGISFIVHLFNSNVKIWSVNNNGGWYYFGFLIGVGVFGSSCSSGASETVKLKRKRY